MEPVQHGTTHRRTRRRRLSTTATVLAVVAVAATVAVTGGLAAGHWLVTRPSPEPTVAASPAGDAADNVQWFSALVGRDGSTVTVYAGAECQELVNARATVTAADAERVEIAVTSRLVPHPDCAGDSAGDVPAEPVVVTRAEHLEVALPDPVGDRALVDAATGWERSVYFEQHFPDLESDSRWSRDGDSQWPLGHSGWFMSYSGPAGQTFELRAGRGFASSEPVETIPAGPHQVTISEPNGWIGSWEVGNVSYAVRLLPSEGGSVTLDEFKQELSQFAWT